MVILFLCFLEAAYFFRLKIYKYVTSSITNCPCHYVIVETADLYESIKRKISKVL